MTMKSKIYRDASGAVINIGDWALVPDPETGEPTNPLPDGAYEDVAEIVAGPDGGLYVADNYAGLRREAYGSWQQQMDLMYHDLETWRTHIAAVKAAYPKP
jgi:hypothetical protein